VTNIETFRARTNYWLGGIATLLTGLFLWSSFLQGGRINEVSTLLIATVIEMLIYIFLIRPRVSYCDEGIIIINPIVRYTIGWRDVEIIDAHWALTLTFREGGGTRTISAWAAPGPDRHHARGFHSSEITGMRIEEAGTMRPALSPRTDSGVATYLAQMRFRRYDSSGRTASLDYDRRVNWVLPAIMLTFIAASVVVNIF
jgi:hypothetical protein